MAKAIYLLVILAVVVGCAFGRPQHHGHRPHRPHRPGQFGGGIPVGGAGFIPGQNLGLLGGGNANAAGLGSGSVVNNQAIGTGTGIANAGPGGFGIGLGVGGAVATPLGNLAFGQGESLSVGK